MPFSYHPPTGRDCPICEQLLVTDDNQPIIHVQQGKSSSASDFPFHNWFYFVLGYTPMFPIYILQRENSVSTDLILDPFVGTGTTQICCKMQGIPSIGVDGNDFMAYSARIKLHWNINCTTIKAYYKEILVKIRDKYSHYRWQEIDNHKITHNLALFNYGETHEEDWLIYSQENRPKMLLRKYVSDKPFVRLHIIDRVIRDTVEPGPIKDLFDLALTSILLPTSNVRYGPGFGIIKAKDDVDVFKLFQAKIDRMLRDLESIDHKQRIVPTRVLLGDSRQLSTYFDDNSVSLIITSPPYPGDHEYTKHTRLELIFRGFATNLCEFRVIKKRLLRASTTNIYCEDNDGAKIQDLRSIQTITNLIQRRLDEDSATSGFEGLYTKLVREYFGGMYKVLAECWKVLRPGGKIAFLVSDSHAFKMVHIQTAVILREIGEKVGFVDPHIILWQMKTSSSHKYCLRENILIMTKPE